MSSSELVAWLLVAVIFGGLTTMTFLYLRLRRFVLTFLKTLAGGSMDDDV